MRCKRVLPVLVFAVSLLSGCIGLLRNPPSHDPKSAELDRVYLDAGGNAPEILRALRSYPPGSMERKAAGLLIRDIPPADAALMRAEDIMEHVDYAFKAREEFPWCRDLPEDIFLHYVLPHRVAQERLVPWRKAFFEELSPRVADAQSMREAALRVNAWCFAQADFVGTDRWDQDPMATIARGLGRCEELAILFISAARSVGIPARTALTPLWRHNNSNHLWVEVWDSGRWHALGAGEIESDYGLAWFMPDMPTAPFVQATVYGDELKTNEEEYFSGRGFTLVNRTAAYTKTGRLHVQVLHAGKPVPDARVFVSIYNGGGLRAFTTVKCDKEGKGSVRLGGGHYLLSIADEDKGSDAETIFVPLDQMDQKDRMDHEASAELDLAHNATPEGVFTMSFPVDPQAKAKAREIFKATDEAVKNEKETVRARRKAEAAKRKAELEKLLPNSPELATAIASAGKNAEELLRAFTIAPEELRDTLGQLIFDMHPKDRVIVKAEDIMQHAQLAVEARERLAALGFNYDDGSFFQMVLPLRFRFENFMPYRRQFFDMYAPDLEEVPLAEIVRKINEHAAGLPLAEERFGFGPATPPAALLQTRRVTAKIEKALYAAAALRSIGVPARMLRDYDFVEWYDGEKLVPLFPDEPEKLGDREADEKVRAWYAEPAVLDLRFVKNGEAQAPKAEDYYRNYSLNRRTPAGTFRSLENINLRTDTASNGTVITLPPGEVYFIMGRRENDRNHFEIERLELAPGERRLLVKDRSALGTSLQPAEPEE